MSSARSLFARLIDHAPTFPPAQLSVPDAIEEDRRARTSDESWILGRLAWPSSKLGELGDEGRELTVIVDGPLVGPDSRIAAVETRAPVPPDIAPEVYVEGGDLDELARRGLRAKVRCGGEHVPSVDELGEFIRGCRERGLPFKATAGLHHAVRQNGGHGFLNVLAAAIFDEDALAEEDAEAFRVTETEFVWRDRAAPPNRGLFVSFGSCSFFEPVEELKALGLV